MSNFGLGVAREQAELAKKIHTQGLGSRISQGLPGLNPQQQSNLRRDYMNSMDLSAMPQFSKAVTKVSWLSLFS